MNAQGDGPTTRSTGSLEWIRSDPTRFAVGLSLLSVPLVAATLLAPSDRLIGSDAAPPMGLPAAVLLAVIAVVPAGAIGGWLGGKLVDRRPLLGVFLALATAWPTAILMLPLAAFAFGAPLATGVLCIDSCQPMLTDDVPLSGPRAYIISLVVAVAAIWPPIVAGGVALAAWFAARRGRVLVGTILVIAAYVVLHLVSIFNGGFVPFLCLAVGVVAWRYLGRERRPVTATPAATEGGADATG